MPCWRDDGQELFFQANEKLMGVVVSGTNDRAGGLGLQVELPRELFTLPSDTGFWLPAKGGERFLVSVPVVMAIPAAIHVVINWNSPLRRRGEGE